jgi:hypothetical protein
MDQHIELFADAATAPMLSDVVGRIEHIFLALPAYDRSFIEPHLACFGAIREALGPKVRCTILCHRAQAGLLEQTLGHYGALDLFDWQDGFVLRLRDTATAVDGKTLRITSMALPDFTSWVQDGFLVTFSDSGQSRISASPRVKRLNGGWDDEVPGRLARHLGWPFELLPCALEAGNVLADHRAVMVGPHVRAMSPLEAWDALRLILGGSERSVLVPAHTRPQPVFHTDLYLTLAGPHPLSHQPMALVGSLRLAHELLDEPHQETEVDEGLDAVCEDLIEAGYIVERIPLLPFEHSLGPEPAWYSYNNCLVEVWSEDRGIRRRVTTPSFEGDGCEKLEAEVARVWIRLGFEVRFVRGAFAQLAPLGGSLRCMTKVLARRVVA